jgi:hypothetical protein
MRQRAALAELVDRRGADTQPVRDFCYGEEFVMDGLAPWRRSISMQHGCSKSVATNCHGW